MPQLDSETLERGIYLDFEQGMNEEIPQIAGVLIDGEYTCYIVDPRLEGAAEDRRVKRRGERWRYREAEELAYSLLNTAEEEGRRIIAYSTAEKITLVELIGEKKRISGLYLNANTASWFRKRRKTTYNRIKREIKRSGRWRKTVGLKDILGLNFVGYDYPRNLKNYSPGRALRDMLSSLKERGDHELVPKNVKRRFTQLHRYNMHDCAGMKHLLEYRLSRDISDSEKKGRSPKKAPAKKKTKPRVQKGYCIRCGDRKKKFDVEKPLCWDCYKEWAIYSNSEYEEDYCHKCGIVWDTTLDKPLCKNCWRKSR